MHALRILTTLCLGLVTLLSAQAQHITPVTRFYPTSGKYDYYADKYLSGFMQSANASPGLRPDGFLQMPFVGDPVLVYVGEKDSTQFMAYASAYEQAGPQTNGAYCALLTRYGIKATLTDHPAYVQQTYVYPDTTAAKGFLIDIDHAAGGKGNEDMDVIFVDRQTVRAYKRGKETGSATPELYYVAHFSAPFDSWNVRRERVTLKDGSKEARLKAAFTFKLKPGEPLRVESAVSATSTDLAYEALPGKLAARHFDDTRVRWDEEGNLLAQNEPQASRAPQKTQRKATATPSATRQSAAPAKTAQADGLVEVASRDGSLTAAFYSAVARLKQRKELRGLQSAADWVERVALLYPTHDQLAEAGTAETDSLLRRYAASVMGGAQQLEGTPLARLQADSQAAWYVLNLIGLHPEANGNYRLHSPSLNVATLYMPGGRRLVVYVRRAAPTRRQITAVRLTGKSLEAPYRITREQLRQGGMLEVTMQE